MEVRSPDRKRRNRPANAVVTLAMLPLPLRDLLGGCAELLDPALDLAVLFG
jgi:hypothetical protein